MADTSAKRDPNWQPVAQGVTDDANVDTRNLLVDPVTGRLKVNTTGTVTVTETAPTDATKVNDSIAITYNASNQPITLVETIGANTYTKTLTWVGSVCTNIGVWV